jgi:succinoglycan biosynthesis transport protein ExoP
VQERNVRRTARCVSDRRMNSIFRALLARWPLIAVSTIACLFGGLWVVSTSAPRYQGNARVVLDYIQPDPVTGEVIPSKMVDAYLESQIRMLRDQQVAAPAAELMGWMDNPDVLAAYAARPASDTRDLAAWVSGILIPRISARMVSGSNIMEISYSGESRELSLSAVEALRTAYIESNVKARQDASRVSAERTQQSLERVRAALAELESLQAQMERETGVVLSARGVDDASQRLRTITRQPEGPVILRDRGVSSTLGDLARLEIAIAQAAQTMGPNNPDLLRMVRQREILRAQSLSEGSMRQAEADARLAQARASSTLYESLKAEVLSMREPALRLRLIQDEINARLEEFRQLTGQLVRLRDGQVNRANTITAVGETYADPTPVFPNPVLVLGGTSGLGVALGSILACLSELMGRRIRTRKHLEAATGAGLLIELPDFKSSRRRPWRRRRQPSAIRLPVVAPAN